MKNQIIVRPLQTLAGEVDVSQRPDDGYIHLNPMADAAGKRVHNWLRLQDTEEYLEELSLETHISASKLILVIQGRGDIVHQGTWAHPQAALKFAGWCNKKFEVQVFKWLELWLTNRGRNIGDMLRLYFHDDATPWYKIVPNAFWEQMERLYNVKYDPKKGAPQGGFPRTLVKRLIISRLTIEYQECLDILNPLDENNKRKHTHAQWMKDGPARQAYETTIQECIRFMRQCDSKEQFERMWAMFGPNPETQLSLIDPRYYLDN